MRIVWLDSVCVWPVWTAGSYSGLMHDRSWRAEWGHTTQSIAWHACDPSQPFDYSANQASKCAEYGVHMLVSRCDGDETTLYRSTSQRRWPAMNSPRGQKRSRPVGLSSVIYPHLETSFCHGQLEVVEWVVGDFLTDRSGVCSDFQYEVEDRTLYLCTKHSVQCQSV